MSERDHDDARDAGLGSDVNASTSRRRIGVVMLLVAAVLWSVSGVAVKVARMDPIAFAFYRSLAAALTMATLLPFSRGMGRAPKAKWAVTSAVLYTAVVSLVIISMTAGTAATGILLEYTGPVFCAIFAWLFQGKRIGPRTLGVLLLATIGIAIMIVGGWRSENWVGPAAGLGCGIVFGGLILVLEKNNDVVGGVNPFALVLINNVGAVLLLLPVCLATKGLAVSPTQFAIVFVTGVVQLAIPYALFQFALRSVRPVDASLLTLLEPVLNPLWVALATSERPDRPTLIGGAIIIIAMIIEALKVVGNKKSA